MNQRQYIFTLYYIGSPGPGTYTHTLFFFFFFSLFSKVIESGKLWSHETAFHVQRILPLVFSGLASPTGEGTSHLSAGKGWEP